MNNYNYFLLVGNHTISTSRMAMLDPTTGMAKFDETLLLDATLYHETKINKYQPKTVIYTPKMII